MGENIDTSRMESVKSRDVDERSRERELNRYCTQYPSIHINHKALLLFEVKTHFI